MEFDINSFANTLKSLLAESMPYEDEAINALKHKGRTAHIKNIALLDNNIIVIDKDTVMFSLGNELAEEDYPYYHILNDAEVIKFRGKSTKKTRGSQSSLPFKERDYNIYSISQTSSGRIKQNYEYKKNVRGERTKINQYGQAKDKNSYVNIHFNYIENSLDGIDSNKGIVNNIADLYGMRVMRKKTTISGEEIENASNYDELNFSFDETLKHY